MSWDLGSKLRLSICVVTDHQRGLITEGRQSARGRYYPVFVENDDFADDRDETFEEIG